MKNVPNRTKIVQGKKIFASVAHYGIELPCLICMAICGLIWPYVAFCGCMWPRMVLMLLFTAITMSCVASFESPWPCVY